MITEADRRWLEEAHLQAVVDIYTPWITNGRLPAREREFAARRVMACRAELARTQDTLPLPVPTGQTLTPTGGGCGA